jgi:hypothetical protein
MFDSEFRVILYRVLRTNSYSDLHPPHSTHTNTYTYTNAHTNAHTQTHKLAYAQET